MRDLVPKNEVETEKEDTHVNLWPLYANVHTCICINTYSPNTYTHIRNEHFAMLSSVWQRRLEHYWRIINTYLPFLIIRDLFLNTQYCRIQVLKITSFEPVKRCVSVGGNVTVVGLKMELLLSVPTQKGKEGQGIVKAACQLLSQNTLQEMQACT